MNNDDESKLVNWKHTNYSKGNWYVWIVIIYLYNNQESYPMTNGSNQNTVEMIQWIYKCQTIIVNG